MRSVHATLAAPVLRCRPALTLATTGLLLAFPQRARAQQRAGTAATPAAAADTQPVTLAEALREARNRNARLPAAASSVDIARARIREARARLFPRLLAAGDLHLGAPQTYATNDALAQLVAVDTLFGAGRQAATRVTRAALTAATAGYQVTERDVELSVRLWFAAYEQAAAEIAFRRAGLVLLQRYLTEVQSLQAAGQATLSDVLQTRVRLGTEQGDIIAAQSRRDDARVALNELMGRRPDAPLVLAARGAPDAPPVVTSDAWRFTPDVALAEANVAAARAAVGITRAERLPQLTLNANVGTQPLLGPASAGAPLNTGRGTGGELTLGVILPIWDAGVYRARLAQAQLLARQAGENATVVMRESRLAWVRALTELNRLYGEVQTRAQTIPTARDAYLLAESAYRGGSGLSLDVLNAYTLWITANQAYSSAVMRYRQAEAQFIRWGAP